MPSTIPAFKRVDVCGRRPTTDASIQSCLLGKPALVKVIVNGYKTDALLDTGATISVVSSSFAKSIGAETRPVNELLNIECANGESLPYSGVTDVDISITGKDTIPGLVLVVPDDKCTSTAPVILGTNLLPGLLRTVKTAPGNLEVVVRCMEEQQEQERTRKDVVALLQCRSDKKIELPPNTRATIPTNLHQALCGLAMHVMVEDTPESQLPSEVDVSPTLHFYDGTTTSDIPAVIENCSTRTVWIRPGDVIAHVTPVILTSMIEKKQAVLLPVISQGLTAPQRQQVEKILNEYQDVFSQNSTDIGHYTGVKHSIIMDDETPFKQRFRRIPPHMLDEVRDHLLQLQASGVIRPSFSPYSSPVVCCRKKDGSLRLCVDYRLLNSKTKKDSYCLPRIEELIDCMRGACYFTKLDLKSGYHHIDIREDHKERTAFTVGPLGFYEHEKLAFGLCNSPATFQRVMEDCFADMNYKFMTTYIDDLTIFTVSFEEHLQRLQEVFQRCREKGLKLAPKKCEIGMDEVTVLGFHVSKAGVTPDPEKVKAVESWPAPRNAKELRSFLGFAGYYRKFVQNFAAIARPLTNLLPPTRTKVGRPVTMKWSWGPTQEEAFSVLKNKLCKAPVLRYPDPGKNPLHSTLNRRRKVM